LPCPAPVANRRNEYVGQLQGKPAVIVSRLAGERREHPNLAQCAAIGGLLAEAAPRRANLPCASWRINAISPGARALPCRSSPGWIKTMPRCCATKLRQQRARRPDLPRGIIHADLFRDNVLFVGEQVSGVLDFYFAGVDDLLFDLAVTVNDWCATATRARQRT
jgi:homoserine kinase type II